MLLTSVDCRVKSLHPPSKHLRGFCDIGHIPRASTFEYCVLDNHKESKDTHSILMPASLIFFAVPPEPRRRTPDSDNARAKSSKSVLSYTDNKAD